MDKNDNEPKIIIYKDKSVLYDGHGNKSILTEGKQAQDAKDRYKKIKEELDKGFLDRIYNRVNAGMTIDENILPKEYQDVLKKLVNSITSEKGRALVVLTVIQLTIKAISPEQSIRLHKSSKNSKTFSWTEGISMRQLDSNYITPFLRKYNLLKLNKFGAFMTRSLAENYPYSSLYKAEIRADKIDWITIVDGVETNHINAVEALIYMLSLLKNQSVQFKELANKAHELAEKIANTTNFSAIQHLVFKISTESSYKARIFEVAIHSLLQALQENHYLEGTLAPMTQMRSANKKHGNVGDAEIYDGKVLIESWDAKYGKEYLRDELEELDDKLLTHPDMKLAGFITDKQPTVDSEIKNRVAEISDNNGIAIHIYSFDEWVNYEIKDIPSAELPTIGKEWLLYFVDSLGQKRRKIAPIDEPTEEWLEECINIFENQLA